MEFRVAGRGTETEARRQRRQAGDASPHRVGHAADRGSDDGHRGEGPRKIRVVAPGTRRQTFMAVRGEGGVAQRPLEEEGGPGRKGQLQKRGMGTGSHGIAPEQRRKGDRFAWNSSQHRRWRQGGWHVGRGGARAGSALQEGHDRRPSTGRSTAAGAAQRIGTRGGKKSRRPRIQRERGGRAATSGSHGGS